MSSTVIDMLATYPAYLGDIDQVKLTRCIEECIACAQACTACADACLSEGTVGGLAKCIRTDMDCADICTATAAVLSRHTGYDANITAAILKACAMVCKACGDELRTARGHARALPRLRAPSGRRHYRRTAPGSLNRWAPFDVPNGAYRAVPSGPQTASGRLRPGCTSTRPGAAVAVATDPLVAFCASTRPESIRLRACQGGSVAVQSRLKRRQFQLLQQSLPLERCH